MVPKSEQTPTKNDIPMANKHLEIFSTSSEMCAN